MMAHHRRDFGTAPNATLDPATFVVRNSNGPGGSEVLVSHGHTRKSRSCAPCHRFVASLLGSGSAHELFHVGRANLPFFLGRTALLSSGGLRKAYVLLHLVASTASLSWLATWRPPRYDLMFAVAQGVLWGLGVDVQVSIEGGGRGEGVDWETPRLAHLERTGMVSRRVRVDSVPTRGARSDRSFPRLTMALVTCAWVRVFGGGAALGVQPLHAVRLYGAAPRLAAAPARGGQG